MLILVALGSLIGRGVYFAVKSVYSINGFCPPGKDNNRYIYQAKVLTGRTTQGKQGLLDAPAKHDSKPEDRFDSVTGHFSGSNIYAVFSDTQAYPEYLITFQCAQ